MRFSIIMPTLNEETALEAQLETLHQLRASANCELLIVDGGSSDQTIAIAQRYGRVLTAERGRARQMNAGAAQARGEVLLFLHADTQLPRNAFMAIEQALHDPAIVGGAFRLRFDCQTLPYRLVASSTNLRSHLSKIFTGDQAYFVRATSFRAIGGYPDQCLMEDLEITRLLRKLGRFVLLAEYVTTSARRHARLGLLKSVLFMWYLRLCYRFGASDAFLQQIYTDIR
jgi:rSAM/selenodomain-associated transferase 2